MKLNDIFYDNEHYSEYADFANQNGYFIQEIEPLNNVRRFQICAPKEKTLDELKSEKLESLSDYANQFDQYKCDKMYVISSVGGYKFNTDIRSQTNIQGLIDMMTDETTLYRDYDNEFRTLTKAELTTLKNECLLNGQHLYQQKWDLQSKINACKSVEELDAIEIKFEMLDFS